MPYAIVSFKQPATHSRPNLFPSLWTLATFASGAQRQPSLIDSITNTLAQHFSLYQRDDDTYLLRLKDSKQDKVIADEPTATLTLHPHEGGNTYHILFHLDDNLCVIATRYKYQDTLNEVPAFIPIYKQRMNMIERLTPPFIRDFHKAADNLATLLHKKYVIELFQNVIYSSAQ